jgi:hypothetical protein
MPICAKATASPSRTVIHRLSEASAIVAPPVQDFDGAFHTMVVSEASASPATFSWTIDPVAAEAAHEQPPSVGAVDQPVREGDLLGLGATHREGEALLRVIQQAAGSRRSRPDCAPPSPLRPVGRWSRGLVSPMASTGAPLRRAPISRALRHARVGTASTGPATAPPIRPHA